MDDQNGKIISNGDLSFHYEEHGPISAPPILLAHAMGTSLRIWDQQIAVLSENFRVIAYDWRGHGHSSAPPGPYTLSEFVDDAVAVLDTLNIRTINWVGISTGGMIGQGLAIKFPNRVNSLCLCNTTPQASEGYRQWVADRQVVVRKEGMTPVWEMTKKLWFTDDFINKASKEYEKIREIFVSTNPVGYIGGTSAVCDLNYLPKLREIKCPTSIIAAGDDEVTPPALSELMHREINNSSMHVIDGQKHFSNVERPKEFNSLLKKHIDRISST